MNDCSKGTERDLAPLYLAGKLGEEEAAAFEEHYFACARCREDVERGSELRAVFGKTPIVATASASRSGRSWLPLAAAAAIAFVGIGAWQLTRRTTEERATSVTRGSAAEVLELKVSAGPQGSVELSWPPHPDAASYRVQILTADEVSVWKTETRQPRLSIGPGVREGGKRLSAEVEALDSMGHPVAKSESIPLPNP